MEFIFSVVYRPGHRNGNACIVMRSIFQTNKFATGEGGGNVKDTHRFIVLNLQLIDSYWSVVLSSKQSFVLVSLIIHLDSIIITLVCLLFGGWCSNPLAVKYLPPCEKGGLTHLRH